MAQTEIGQKEIGHTDTEQAVDEFLGDAPRASEWHALRQALTDRRRGLRSQRQAETGPAAQAALDKEITALGKQIATLETEEVVSTFVEDSVRASLARAPRQGEEDFEE